MKNLFITLMLTGIILYPNSAKAQRHGSELKLRMFDNSYFTVIFDRNIYDSPVTLFRLSDLTPGKHRLIIKKRLGHRYGTFRTIFNGNINIPVNSVVDAEITNYNNLIVRRITPLRSKAHSRYNTKNYYNKPLLNVHRLNANLRAANFENDKRMIAEQAISSHKVKANQIYSILMMFSFESTKLKVAKFAYHYCIDKRNYFIVNDAFTFSSSIRELDNFIGNYKSNYYDDDWSRGRDYYNKNQYENNRYHRH